MRDRRGAGSPPDSAAKARRDPRFAFVGEAAMPEEHKVTDFRTLSGGVNTPWQHPSARAGGEGGGVSSSARSGATSVAALQNKSKINLTCHRFATHANVRGTSPRCAWFQKNKLANAATSQTFSVFQLKSEAPLL